MLKMDKQPKSANKVQIFKKKTTKSLKMQTSKGESHQYLQNKKEET